MRLGVQGNTMPHLLEQDRSGLFTVVGAPYVAEEHHDPHSHYQQDSLKRSHGVLAAGPWLALYAAIVVLAIVSKGGLGWAVEMVMAMTH